MRYVHAYNDADGESHFVERELEMTRQDIAPPADPALSSEELPVNGMRIMRLSPGWHGKWHPSPYRLWMLVLSGSSVCQVSDGERRTTRPGDLYLFEDIDGRGHLSMNASDEDLVVAIVRLRSQQP